MKSMETDAPFDVVFLDIWEPGDTTTKRGEKKVLTCLEHMTGFAEAAFLQDDINSSVSGSRGILKVLRSEWSPKISNVR